MSKFHVSKKKKEKKRKSALKIIYMYPCMIVFKKKVFHFKSRFHNHKLDACHKGSLHNNKGESRENVT